MVAEFDGIECYGEKRGGDKAGRNKPGHKAAKNLKERRRGGARTGD